MSSTKPTAPTSPPAEEYPTPLTRLARGSGQEVGIGIGTCKDVQNI